ncbi:transporter substrate-binding domain-containing protein [Parasalinivibrio latis]|uniref:substrate-binding periplasmic protein n=1 Tax=Parasalinivibrio latis TaxID=2952610 RepID=UPI0030DF7229
MKKYFIFLAGLVTACSAFASTFDNLRFVTEEYPPYNYTENGELKGIAVELLLKSAQGEIGTSDIRVWPWARGYAEAQSGPNTVLFSTTRTPQRESIFKWVGPITETKVVVIVNKSQKDESLSSLVEKSKKSIAVVRDDIGEQRLALKMPDAKVIKLSTPDQAAKMLRSGRVSGWAYEENVAYWILEKQGAQRGDFVAIDTLLSGKLYFAVSPDVSDKKVKAMNNAVLRAKGKE